MHVAAAISAVSGLAGDNPGWTAPNRAGPDRTDGRTESLFLRRGDERCVCCTSFASLWNDCFSWRRQITTLTPLTGTRQEGKHCQNAALATGRQSLKCSYQKITPIFLQTLKSRLTYLWYKYFLVTYIFPCTWHVLPVSYSLLIVSL